MSIEEIENKCDQLRELGMDDSIIDMQRSKWMEQLDAQEKNLYNPSKPAAQTDAAIDRDKKILEKQHDTSRERAGLKSRIFGSQLAPKNYIFDHEILDTPNIVYQSNSNRRIHVPDSKQKSGYRTVDMSTITPIEAANYKFAPDFDYSSSTDSKARAAYRVKNLNEQINSMKQSKRKDKANWTDSDEEKLNGLRYELKNRARWYVPTTEEVEGKKNEKLLTNKEGHVAKEKALKERTNKGLSFEFDDNGNLIEGHKFNLPFDKNAQIIWGLGRDSLSAGVFPLHVISGGREQLFNVPWRETKNYMKMLNDWSGGNMSVSYNTPENMSEDKAAQLRAAIKNGHYEDTVVPKLAGNVDVRASDKARGTEYGEFYKDPLTDTWVQDKFNMYPGQRELWDANSNYNSKNAYKRNLWLNSHAEDVAAAEELGLSLNDYYNKLYNERMGNLKIDQNALEADLFNSYDTTTGKLKSDVDEGEYREKLYQYLKNKIRYGDFKSAREKANRIIDTLENGDPENFKEQEDALTAIPRALVAKARADIRDVQRNKNLKVEKEAKELASIIRQQQGYKNRIDEYNNLKKAGLLFDSLPDTDILVTPEGMIIGEGNDGEQGVLGSLNELVGGVSAKQLLDSGLIKDKPVKFTRADDYTFKPAIEGLGPIVRRNVPDTIDKDIEAMQAAYDAMGGDEQYSAWKNFLLNDFDKLFDPHTMGTMPHELRRIQATDSDGNPIIGANGEPVMIPRILLQATNPELEEEYEKAGVPSRKRGRNYLSFFNDINGNFDEDLYNNWIDTNLAYQKSLLDGASLGQDIAMINGFEGLPPEQRARNQAIFDAANKEKRWESIEQNISNKASDAAKLAARDALRRRYARFMGSLLAPDEDLEDLRPEEIRNLGLAAGEWRNVFPFNMYAQLNAGDDTRDAKAMQALIARLKQLGKL